MLIGVDVGGTKTTFLLTTDTGAVCAQVHAGPGNWEGIGIDQAAVLYRDGVAQLLATAGCPADTVTVCGWGLAGYDWPSDGTRLRTIIEPIVPAAQHILLNDAEIALRAGSRHPYGVGAIAGTGSTVVARGRDGQRARTFGLGSDWGDFDGAQGLGRAALRATAHAHYGVDTPTSLTAAVLDWSGAADIPSFAERYSRGEPFPDLATLAPIVVTHAGNGDAAARRIVVDAGLILGQNIAAMARRVALESHAFDIVLAGGVATSGSRVLRDTIALVVAPHCPQADITILAAPPVIGAVLSAADLLGLRLDPTEIK
jgi:N-acetylglucosamine kinase-like BadF-type ATPase